MAILQLVDQLAEVLQHSRPLPLSNYRVVDAREVGLLLERMRISVPSSIRESERTIADRDRILDEAHAEATRMVAEARAQARHMLSREQIVAAAREEAERIVAEGERNAQRHAREADEYAIQVLQTLSGTLHTAHSQVQNGIQIMQNERAPTEAK